MKTLRSDFDTHTSDKFAHHGDYDHKGLVDLVTTLPSAGINGRFIVKTDTLELYYDNGSSIVKIGKLAGLDLDAHGSRHNIGGADEIPDLAKLRSDFDSHKESTTDHVPSGKYICATSRSDQAPSWNDIPDKPSAFPPEAHTHSIKDIEDIVNITELRRDTSANRPTAGVEGRIFFETDTKRILFDNGSTWIQLGVATWDKLENKPSQFPPEPHGTTHNIGASDEIPDLKTLRNDFDSHKNSTTDHVPSGKYICATSRSDQLPSWNDIPDKPSKFPPEPHASSHLPNGDDPLFDQSLNTTDSPKFAGLTVDSDINLGGNIKAPYKLIGGIKGWLGIAPFLMSNILGFRTPYKAELSTDKGSTWSDVTTSYTWAYLTDGKATEVAISVTGGQETWIRLYYDVGAYTFASALCIVARWMSRLTYVKVEASSYSDFSQDVVTLYEEHPNIGHHDETSLHLFNSHPAGRRYIRITIGFVRDTDGEVRFRQLILLGYADIHRMWEGYFPFEWDHNKNMHFLGDVAIDRKLDVAGDFCIGGTTVINSSRNLVGINRIAENLLPDNDNTRDLGSSSLRWKDGFFAGKLASNYLYGNLATGLPRVQGYKQFLVLRGWDSDFAIAIQDGSGRVNIYWDAYFDGSHKYAVGDGEGASRLRIHGKDGFRFYTAPSGNAGDTISWIEDLHIGHDFIESRHLRPYSDNAFDLGTSNLRWRSIYCINLYASDIGLENGFRIVEAEKLGLGRGIAFVNPEGRAVAWIDENGILHVRGVVND